MHKYYKILLIIILEQSFVSCDNPNSPGKPAYNYSLLFNLTVNKNNQNIFLFRTAKENEEVEFFFDRQKYFIKGAKIELNDSVFNYSNFTIGSSFSEPFYQKEFYYKNHTKLDLFPFTKYYLEIRIDGKIIKGITQTPGGFGIISPVNNGIIHEDEIININWTKSTNAKGYIVNISNSYSLQLGDSIYYRTEYFSNITADTSFVFSNTFAHKGSGSIEIIAFDENYKNHIIQKVPSAGIEGAYGYFGSSVLKSVTVRIN